MSKVPFVIYYWDSLVYIFVKPHNVLIYYIAKFFFIKSNYVARNGEVASPDGCIEVTAILLIIFRFSLRPEGIYHGNLSELFSRKMKENYTFEAVWDALGDMLMDEHERVSLLSLSSWVSSIGWQQKGLLVRRRSSFASCWGNSRNAFSLHRDRNKPLSITWNSIQYPSMNFIIRLFPNGT